MEVKRIRSVGGRVCEELEWGFRGLVHFTLEEGVRIFSARGCGMFHQSLGTGDGDSGCMAGRKGVVGKIAQEGLARVAKGMRELDCFEQPGQFTSTGLTIDKAF